MFMSNKVKEPKPSHKAKLVALYSVEEVMFWLHTITSRRFVTPSGGSVQATRTLKLFKKKGVDCVLCGMNGKFFKEWCVGEDHFLCLYGLKELNGNSRHVLMTADHIFPKSLGGMDNFENLQPMCSECNNTKGCNIIKSVDLDKNVEYNWVEI